MDLYQLPVHEVEREEGYDEEDPMAVRFKWTTHPHRRIQNFEMLHFRLFGNDALLPYGTSTLEASRRAFQQYLMMFDAMMIYRMVRAPERLVFQIEVGNTPPEEVEQFLEEQKTKLKTATAVDSSQGIMDRRYDPINVTEDFFIAKRGDQGSRIEQLPGGTIQGDTEDIEVAINRYISGLKVPKPYLDYSEEWAKANIANLDIRFSKTIRRIQNALMGELTKAGLIHLMTMGIEGNALFEWDLEMSNPSTIAELQKLEMWEKRLSIVSSAKGTEILDDDFIYDTLLNFSDDDKKRARQGLIRDAMQTQLKDKTAEHYAEKLEGGEEEPPPAEAEEEKGEKGGGGEGPPPPAGLKMKGEAKSSYGIPQEKKPELGSPSTEEQLKRTIPNEGDSLEDPYDEEFLKKTATNIMEDPDALEEAAQFALETEGRIIVGQKQMKRAPDIITMQNRTIQEIREGMAVRSQEILAQEATHDTEVIVDDDDDEMIVMED
jgi:hypothetical protein